jgi:hypothetical protein
MMGQGCVCAADTDWPLKPREQTATTVAKCMQRRLFALIVSLAICIRDARTQPRQTKSFPWRGNAECDVIWSCSSAGIPGLQRVLLVLEITPRLSAYKAPSSTAITHSAGLWLGACRSRVPTHRPQVSLRSTTTARLSDFRSALTRVFRSRDRTMEWRWKRNEKSLVPPMTTARARSVA